VELPVALKPILVNQKSQVGASSVTPDVAIINKIDAQATLLRAGLELCAHIQMATPQTLP